jgi:hypothetical protein
MKYYQAQDGEHHHASNIDLPTAYSAAHLTCDSASSITAMQCCAHYILAYWHEHTQQAIIDKQAIIEELQFQHVACKATHPKANQSGSNEYYHSNRECKEAAQFIVAPVHPIRQAPRFSAIKHLNSKPKENLRSFFFFFCPRRPEIPRTRLPAPTEAESSAPVHARPVQSGVSHQAGHHRYPTCDPPPKKRKENKLGKVRPDATLQFTPCLQLQA